MQIFQPNFIAVLLKVSLFRGAKTSKNSFNRPAYVPADCLFALRAQLRFLDMMSVRVGRVCCLLEKKKYLRTRAWLKKKCTEEYSKSSWLYSFHFRSKI